MIVLAVKSNSDTYPHVANDLSENPLSFDLVEHRHWHDENCNAEIADSKANQQVVAGPPQLSHQTDRYAYQYVPYYSTKYDYDQYDGDDDALQRRVDNLIGICGIRKICSVDDERYVGRHTNGVGDDATPWVNQRSSISPLAIVCVTFLIQSSSGAFININRDNQFLVTNYTFKCAMLQQILQDVLFMAICR